MFNAAAASSSYEFSHALQLIGLVCRHQTPLHDGQHHMCPTFRAEPSLDTLTSLQAQTVRVVPTGINLMDGIHASDLKGHLP